MTYNVIAALALLCVFEGMLPFLSPRLYRRFIITLASQPDTMIRRMGLICMLIGLIVLAIAHRFIG